MKPVYGSVYGRTHTAARTQCGLRPVYSGSIGCAAAEVAIYDPVRDMSDCRSDAYLAMRESGL